MATLTMTVMENGQMTETKTTEVKAKKSHAPRHRGRGHLAGEYADTCAKCRELHADITGAMEVTPGPKPNLSVDLNVGEIIVVPSLWLAAMELAGGNPRKIKVLAHNRVLVG